MRYVPTTRITWAGLAVAGVLLTVLLPGHLVAIIGSAIASLAAFLLYPRQPWWVEVPDESTEAVATISVRRAVATYAVLYAFMLLPVGIGWFVVDLIRLGTTS